MGRSLNEIYIHHIWTTRDREPILRGELEMFVHRRIDQIADEHDISVLASNSAWNHTHVLASWNTTTVVADVIKQWKAGVSHAWNNQVEHDGPELRWQSGAGNFSIGRHEVERLINYIANQKRHHRDRTTVHRYERRYGPAIDRHGRSRG